MGKKADAIQPVSRPGPDHQQLTGREWEATFTELRQVEALTAQGKQPLARSDRGGLTATYYRRCTEYGGMKGDQVKRLTERETEASRLSGGGGFPLA